MNPVIIEDTTTLAPNAQIANLIVINASLRRYLRAPFRARGKLVMVTTAAGITIDLDYGSKNVVAGATLRVDGTPIMQEPNDVINDDWYCEEGDQLTLRAVNNTAGSITVRWRLVLEPWDGEFPPDTRILQVGPVSIAANTVDQQLLDGLRYERPPVDSVATLWMTASASPLTRQVYVNMDAIAPPSIISPNNRIPMDPFDINIAAMEVPKDSLISVPVSNATGGAINVFAKLALKEMERT